jgi:thiol-disulfide isomerase/thioredoxin
MNHAIPVIFLVLVLLGCTSETDNPVEMNTTNETPIIQDTHIAATPIPLPSNTTKNVTTTDTVYPVLPEYDFSNITNEGGGLIVYYFYSPNCIASQAINPTIRRVESNYSEIELRRYDLTTQNGSIAYVQFAEQHNLNSSQRLVPQVLVNGTIITDRFNIEDRLEDTIKEYRRS